MSSIITPTSISTPPRGTILGPPAKIAYERVYVTRRISLSISFPPISRDNRVIASVVWMSIVTVIPGAAAFGVI